MTVSGGRFHQVTIYNNFFGPDFLHRQSMNRTMVGNKSGWLAFLSLAALLLSTDTYASVTTDLIEAVELNDPIAVNVTLENGGDPDMVHEGDPILMAAIDMGHFDAAQSLLQYKANVRVKDSRGLDPLHAAAELGHVAMTQLFLKYWDGGREIDHKIEGLSAFHRACQGHSKKHAHTVEMMMAHGASPTAKTDSGHTPYDLAQHAGNKRTVKVLLEHLKQKHPQGYMYEEL